MGAAAPGPAISRGPHFWEVQKINSCKSKQKASKQVAFIKYDKRTL